VGVKVIENFLEDNFFEDLRKLIIESEFSWFKRREFMVLVRITMG
jgi:hypothetical protein